VERAGQDIGHDQVGPQPPEGRVRQALGDKGVDLLRQAGFARIVFGDGHRDGIVVARHHRPVEGARGGDRQDAGARAEIEHEVGAPALCQRIQHQEAAAR
jgi:hypothetical protein